MEHLFQNLAPMSHSVITISTDRAVFIVYFLQQTVRQLFHFLNVTFHFYFIFHLKTFQIHFLDSCKLSRYDFLCCDLEACVYRDLDARSCHKKASGVLTEMYTEFFNRNSFNCIGVISERCAACYLNRFPIYQICGFLKSLHIRRKLKHFPFVTPIPCRFHWQIRTGSDVLLICKQKVVPVVGVRVDFD